MADRQVSHRSFVSYIDKSREYYAASGYERPYRWAAYDDVPFTPLTPSLADCNVAVVTTSFLPVPKSSGGARGIDKRVYSHPSADRPESMFTADLAWDKQATNTDDPESFLPLDRLAEFANNGRIGALNHRFFGVPTEYSQRTTARHAEHIAAWCEEDRVDAVVLAPL